MHIWQSTRPFRALAPALYVMLGLSVGLASWQASAAEMMVSVKTTSIKASKDFAAAGLAKLTHGQRLEVLKEESGWYQVRQQNITGWVHGSAVAKPQQQASLGRALGGLAGKPAGPAVTGKGFSEDEVSLAGKGFNAQVEKAYQKSNTKADFQSVDRMEKLSASSQAISTFAKNGKLSPRADAKVTSKAVSSQASSVSTKTPGFLD